MIYEAGKPLMHKSMRRWVHTGAGIVVLLAIKALKLRK